MDAMVSKYCKACGEDKPLSAFYQNKKTGYWNSYCKPCTVAKTRKWIDSHKEQHKGNLKSWNERNRGYRKAWSDKNPGYDKAYQKRQVEDGTNSRGYRRRRLKQWGLTLDDVRKAYDLQGGLCAICQDTISLKKNGTAHMDHCHKGNFFRGLLCRPCNRGLGFFHDDPVLMLKAIEYLKKHNCS